VKNNIHPKVHKDTVVTCACGNSFVTASTLKTITLEICSACHPFYTGTQKFVDTEGRIEKFARKLKATEEMKGKEKPKKKSLKGKTKGKESTEQPAKPQTLKEMLKEASDDKQK
jgi:large subunit ribosomal protein L31